MVKQQSKRSNPDYTQIFGYVPKTMAVKFRTLCASKELQQSEVIEKILGRWIEEQESEK